MRNIRGLVALAVSLLLAFFISMLVYRQVSKPAAAPLPKKTAAPAPAPKKKALSDAIPPGMRAFSIQVDQVTGLPGQIRPGDRVDVVATSPLPENSGNITRVILENIEILKAGPSAVAEPNKTKRRHGHIISLLVTPEQGVTLAAAAAASKIMLLSRNNNDTQSARMVTTAFSPETGAEAISKEDVSSWAEAIPNGMRAITVAVSDTDGLAGRLHRGDRVDVIATCHYARLASDSKEPGVTGTITEFRQGSRTVLQDIEVLGTEKEAALSIGLPKAVRLVTLLATPIQAEKLTAIAHASKKASIKLIHRNATDRRTINSRGQLMGDLILFGEHVPTSTVPIFKGTRRTQEVFFE